MRILCFIDNLGSGGAQRQLTNLAVGLKKRGHEVGFLLYHTDDYFLPVLQKAGISCRTIGGRSQLARVISVRRVLRQCWQDVVLAFLEGPSLYAELARIPAQRWGVVAGERLAHPGIVTGLARLIRQAHRAANSVITNSHTNRLMLLRVSPFLRDKIATVYNTVDLERFRSSVENRVCRERGAQHPCRIVVAASYQGKKNMMGVAEAVLLLRKRGGGGRQVVVDWYGAIPPNRSAFDSVTKFVNSQGLADCLRFHKTTAEIDSEFRDADAVGLFSFFEGLPNAICEGMACGKPIVLSNVCDADNLVNEGVNGFLCEPANPASIADALQKLAQAGSDELRRMGQHSRKMAEILFNEETILRRYEDALFAAVRGLGVPPCMSWPAQVPQSAELTVRRMMA